MKRAENRASRFNAQMFASCMGISYRRTRQASSFLSDYAFTWRQYNEASKEYQTREDVQHGGFGNQADVQHGGFGNQAVLLDDDKRLSRLVDRLVINHMCDVHQSFQKNYT